MKKFLVLTSITNGKDDLEDPKVVFDNCDYIAFVDKTYDNINVWEQRKIFNFSTVDSYQNRRNAKPYKILSSIMFPQYEYIIWHDGNHNLKINPQEIIEKYGEENDILLFKHPDRTCVYQEINACAQWRLDHLENLNAVYGFFKSVNVPENYGLYELSSFIIKTTHVVKELQLMWWEVITRFSSRDQISLPYCLWKLGDKIKKRRLVGYSNLVTLKGNLGGNEYFDDKGSHKKIG